MVRRSEQGVSEESLRAATGRGRQEWRDLLEQAGALGWTHTQTAAWLVDEHGVDGWWAQGITVDFEQSRKGRLPGQQKDGTFVASVSRTIPRPRLQALEAVAAQVRAVYGEPHGQNLEARMPVVRWRLDDGTRMSATAAAEKATGTPVDITREKLAAAQDVEPAKDELVGLLEAARDSG